MRNNTLQTFAIGVTLMTGLSLSACNGSEKTTVGQSASDTSATQSPEENSSSATTTTSDLDGATVGDGTPVSYDVASWDKDSADPIDIKEFDKIKAAFGKVLSSDENSLDYASNPATKYRYMDTDAPYLDIIDSTKYLELGWYYANPNDTDKEKDISRAHAKKAYQLGRQLMGDDGGKVIAEMLNGQIIKNKAVNGQKIELAKCEFYSCMLILNKAAAEASVTETADNNN